MVTSCHTTAVVRENSQTLSHTHTHTAQCVVPHPVPVKTESQTVQLLPHGYDITERRGDKGITEERRQEERGGDRREGGASLDSDR